MAFTFGCMDTRSGVRQASRTFGTPTSVLRYPCHLLAIAFEHGCKLCEAPLPSRIYVSLTGWFSQVVRRSLKEAHQAKAKLRDVSHMKVIEYEGGKTKAVRKFHCPLI